MKGKILRRTLAAVMATVLVGGALPFEAGTFALPGHTLTASAEDYTLQSNVMLPSGGIIIKPEDTVNFNNGAYVHTCETYRKHFGETTNIGWPIKWFDKEYKSSNLFSYDAVFDEYSFENSPAYGDWYTTLENGSGLNSIDIEEDGMSMADCIYNDSFPRYPRIYDGTGTGDNPYKICFSREDASYMKKCKVVYDDGLKLTLTFHLRSADIKVIADLKISFDGEEVEAGNWKNGGMSMNEGVDRTYTIPITPDDLSKVMKVSLVDDIGEPLETMKCVDTDDYNFTEDRKYRDIVDKEEIEKSIVFYDTEPLEYALGELPCMGEVTEKKGFTYYDGLKLMVLNGEVVCDNFYEAPLDADIVMCETGTKLGEESLAAFNNWYTKGFMNVRIFDLNNLDISYTKNMYQMFAYCENAEVIKIDQWDVSHVESFKEMFYKCHKLKEINIGHWDTSSSWLWEGMFKECESLTKISLGNPENENTWCMRDDNTGKKGSIMEMFKDCTNLESLYLYNFEFYDQLVKDMFAGCTNITYLYVGKSLPITLQMRLRNITYDEDGCVKYMRWFCPLNAELYTGNEDYAEIPNMEHMGITYFSEKSQLSPVLKGDDALINGMPIPGESINKIFTRSFGDKYKTSNSIGNVIEYENAYIDDNYSGWYDLDNDRFMEADDVFRFGGHYVFRVRYMPGHHEIFRHDEMDMSDFSLSFNNNVRREFGDIFAVQMHDFSEMDIYATVPEKFTNLDNVDDPDSTAETNYLDYQMPGYVRFANRDYEKTNIYPVAGLKTVELETSPFSVTWTNYPYKLLEVYENTDNFYEWSIDGVNYVTAFDHPTISGLYPGTEYKVYVRKNGASEPFYTEKITTVDANEAGSEYIAEESENVVHVDTAFKHNCEFSSNIAMHYVVPKADFEGMNNIRLFVSKEVYSKGSTVPSYQNTVITSYNDLNVGGTEMYEFVFPGITSVDMSSNIYATVYADKDGKSYISKADKYSIKAFATDRLAKSQSASFKILMVDMLNYGTAAQQHFGINTANLANSSLTAAQKKLGTQTDYTSVNNESVKTLSGAIASFSGKNLQFDTNIILVYRLKMPANQDMSNIKVVYKYTRYDDIPVTVTVPASELTKSGDYYLVSFSSLCIPDLRKIVSATIYDGSKPISDTLSYSVESYVYNRMQNSASGTFKTLLNNMMNYSVSAEKHFG